jgi:mono/diheme cytochrome c family protein
MEVSMLPNSTLTLLLLLSLFFPGQIQNPAAASSPNPATRIPLDGAKIYQHHCATCHGADGSGHGPTAASLKEAPPDLKLISQRNGGKFPHQNVKDMIEGARPTPTAHGTREMPIWGPIFHQIEADQDWGEVRLDAVTKYVESIQQR